MKAILVTRTGDPSVLDYVEMPTPRPKTGEVLVKADTIGVNRPDVWVRSGVYPWMPPLPAIPGIEIAGTVADFGDGVSDFSTGENVYVSARELPHRAGGYAEYIAVPANALRRLPTHVDLEFAACLSSYYVAYHLIHTATRGVTGKSALIDNASGGIGSAAVQLAKIIDMTPVIALVGSDEKAEALRDFGADHAINIHTQDVASCVKETTGGRGVDLVLNAAGGVSLNEQLGLLAPLGLAVSYGRMQGPPVDLLSAVDPGGAAGDQSVAVRFLNVHTFDHEPEYRAVAMRYLIDRLADGAIKPRIHAKLSLRDARRAHEMLESRQVIGNILLKPEH